MSLPRPVCLLSLVLAVGPLFWLSGRFLRGLAPRVRAGILGGVVLAVVAGIALAPPHEDLYTGLDVASYRLMARAFRAGRPLHAHDAALATVPPEVRRALQAKPAKASRDGVFRFDTADAALRTEPYFLPAMPLAAAALPDPDLFAPLIGALWLLAVASFAAGAAGTNRGAVARALLAATGATLLTPFPAWFLRGFHPDAVGAVLLSAGWMAGVAGVPFAAGLLAGLSTAFHLELALPALAVAVITLAVAGSWRANGRFLVGSLLGTLPAVLELAFVCNPYFRGVSPAAFLAAARAVPELGALAVLLPLGAAAGLGVLALLPCRRVRARLAEPRMAQRLAAALLAVALLPPLAALAGMRLGCPELARGMASVHPALAAAWGAVVVACALDGLAARPFAPKRVLTRALHLLLVSATGLFFVYVKGREIPVGMWSYRRFLPAVALLVPWVAESVATAGARAKTRAGAWAPSATLAAVAACIIVSLPAAYRGVGDRGSEELAERVATAIADADIAMFDYFGHAVPHAAVDPSRRVFGLGDYVAGRLPDVVRWLRGEVESGTHVAVVTGFEPCTLEDGLTLEAQEEIKGTTERLATRRLLPSTATGRALRDTVCVARSAGPGCAQRKVFDGGPLGLRGEWRRAPRGGQWSGNGAGIVGPVPSSGEVASLSLRVSWYDASGTNPVQTVRVLPPCGLAEQTFRVAGPGETVTVRIGNAGPAPTATGVYRIVGEVVFHEATIEISPEEP